MEQTRSVRSGQHRKLLLLKCCVTVSVLHCAPRRASPQSGHSQRAGEVTPPTTAPATTLLFLPHLRVDSHVFLCSCRSKCRVAEVFVRLLEKMWMGSSSSCAPVEARSVLCSILPQFNNYAQQDAQELLLYLLNALHDDLRKVHQSHHIPLCG